MFVEHTRCSVDGGFGLTKKKFRSSDCDTPEQLQATINASAEQNTTYLFQWQWHDWDEFLWQKFRQIVGITKFQHFRFSEEFPGAVEMKETVNGPETTFNLAKVSADEIDASPLLDVLLPGGFTDARKTYLLHDVLECCRPKHRHGFKNAVC